MYKYKKNLLGLGAGLSFAFMAFFAPSVTFADDETLSTDYNTYSVSVDSDTGAITLTETDKSYDVTVESGATSLNDDEVYYGNTSTTAGAALSSTTAGADISADFVSNTASVSASNSGSNGGAVIVNTNLGTISGDFIGNWSKHTSSGNAKAATGGAIYMGAYTIDAISGNFYGNIANVANTSSNYTKTVQGGAIYNNGGTITSITSDFSDNAAYSNTGVRNIAYGGAISNAGTISSLEGNFYNNYVWAATAKGGAVYAASSSTTTFTASEGKDYYYLGNYAMTASTETKSDANGGFLYMNSATVSFDTAESASITIGYTTTSSAYAEGYDSIAGTGSITKTGAGTLTVNSSMEYYTGSLTVSAGSMYVNNTLSASSISVASGASLEVDVLNVYLSSTSASSLNLITIADGASFSMDVLAIYLSEDFVLGTSVEIYDDSSISSAVVAYYTDADGNYVQLSEEGFTFVDGTFTYDATIAAVPEPSTYAMIIGVIALGFAYYRRRK